MYSYWKLLYQAPHALINHTDLNWSPSLLSLVAKSLLSMEKEDASQAFDLILSIALNRSQLDISSFVWDLVCQQTDIKLVRFLYKKLIQSIGSAPREQQPRHLLRCLQLMDKAIFDTQRKLCVSSESRRGAIAPSGKVVEFLLMLLTRWQDLDCNQQANILDSAMSDVVSAVERLLRFVLDRFSDSSPDVQALQLHMLIQIRMFPLHVFRLDPLEYIAAPIISLEASTSQLRQLALMTLNAFCVQDSHEQSAKMADDTRRDGEGTKFSSCRRAIRSRLLDMISLRLSMKDTRVHFLRQAYASLFT
eukprot:TRINITY_DN5831_c0_g4_i2.p1 TRINITY_DN5831_c0_g4~~TRINITY_DN5831_c0_g4_i2.p1  ORF type:complete len:305 (-),score=67.68 TRINITY_DN5831_c0_g4_i2:130-1044(-)